MVFASARSQIDHPRGLARFIHYAHCTPLRESKQERVCCSCSRLLLANSVAKVLNCHPTIFPPKDETSRDEVPHMFTRQPRLQPEIFDQRCKKAFATESARLYRAGRRSAGEFDRGQAVVRKVCSKRRD
jgi:hypothetical protein